MTDDRPRSAGDAAERPRPRPYTGPSKQEVLALRRQYCHPSTFLYYREPLMVVEGHMQYL